MCVVISGGRIAYSCSKMTEIDYKFKFWFYIRDTLVGCAGRRHMHRPHNRLNCAAAIWLIFSLDGNTKLAAKL